MGSLYQFVALLPMIVSAGPEALWGEVRQQQPRRFVTIEREGLPPVILGGSDEILARNDLVGTWQVTDLEYEGVSRPEVAADLQWAFSRGRLELMQQGRPTIVVAYDIDLSRTPPGFKWKLAYSHQIAQQKGIYWLEGDTLMICLGTVNARGPSEFLTQPGDGRTLFVLQRPRPSGETTSLSDAEWMPLGTFVLAEPDQAGGNMVVRMSVNHQGTVAGQAYDLQTKSGRPLEGSVDKRAARISWTVGTDKALVMETSLESVTQEQSSVQVRRADGSTETWAMTYMFAPSASPTGKSSP